MYVVEIAFERDLHVDILQLMPIAAPRDLHETHARFSVVVLYKLD
jgi:hypothetical protein